MPKIISHDIVIKLLSLIIVKIKNSKQDTIKDVLAISLIFPAKPCIIKLFLL